MASDRVMAVAACATVGLWAMAAWIAGSNSIVATGVGNGSHNWATGGACAGVCPGVGGVCAQPVAPADTAHTAVITTIRAPARTLPMSPSHLGRFGHVCPSGRDRPNDHV